MIRLNERIMDLRTRIDLLSRLGEYMTGNGSEWKVVKEKAGHENSWFTPEFVELAISAISREFLQKEKLNAWVESYSVPARQEQPKTVGIVMAGNIPLVGFHDFVSTFISGHRQMIKLSSKDQALLKHIVEKLSEWNSTVAEYVSFGEMLKGCDAYLATGSNNSARYFDYYFKKYRHIIRRNRTSVAILSGNETKAQLEKLADDVYQYFGLGCRNVTKIYVPNNYDFIPLLEVFKKYDYLSHHNKYKNNYDYQLAILILNKKYYMTNGSILLAENNSPFSPISQLHYEFYESEPKLDADEMKQQVQCVVGRGGIAFGLAQQPTLLDYADGSDTLLFLLSL
jgi:Acyl-CoA reductase (LuxC)